MMDIDSQEVPFGAEVLDEKNNVVGVVGQGGRVMILLARQPGEGEKTQPKLRVKWGDAPGQQCMLEYTLPKQNKPEKRGFERVRAICAATTLPNNRQLLPNSRP